MNVCPDCDRPLALSATTCRCGWRASKLAVAQPLGYQQCEWRAHDERCHYPGSISPNVREGGPYYCRLHFGCKDGAWGATVVEASRDYRHPTEDEINAERTARARKSLEEKGLSRKPDESEGAWRKRMLQFWKERHANIAKPIEQAA